MRALRRSRSSTGRAHRCSSRLARAALLATLAASVLATGCAEDACKGEQPSFQLDVSVQDGALASRVRSFVVDVTVQSENRRRTFEIGDELGDGVVSLGVRIEPAPAGETSILIAVRAFAQPAGAGDPIAEGSATLSATPDGCNRVTVKLGPSAGEDAGTSDGGELADAGEADSGEDLDAGLADAAEDAEVPSDAGEDAGSPEDSGASDVGFPEDTGTPDAGFPTDTGLADAGFPPDTGPDAGFPIDAGFPTDTGPDAGFPPDTGPDAGFPPDTGPDAGFPPDTGPDAGLVDAGCTPGLTCDDLDTTTFNDFCLDGDCRGYETVGCSNSNCGGQACLPGACCARNCPGGSCPACGQDCSCDWACNNNAACAADCLAGAVCHLNSTNTAVLSVNCEAGSSCSVDCAQTATCVLNCDVDAYCMIASCVASSCTLACPVQVTNCGGGVQVCNRPCP